MAQPTDLAKGPALTPELAQRLLEGAGSGLHKETVAACCGIDAATLDAWLTEGLSPTAIEPYRTFARLYRAREEGVQDQIVASVLDAARRDWKAGLAFLAARFPERWGPKAARQNAADLAPESGAADEALAEDLLESPEFAEWAAARGYKVTKE